MSTSSSDIIKSLTGLGGKWSPHKLLIAPNTTSVSYWESDLLIIQDSGWCEEVEIKISVADFRAELRNKQEKHDSIKRGFMLVKRWDYRENKALEPKKVPTIIRRFWFAMPEDVFQKVNTDIPEWAGVLVIGPEKRSKYSQTYQWRQERAAMNLPAQKCDQAQRSNLLLSVYHRAWSNGWLNTTQTQEGS